MKTSGAPPGPSAEASTPKGLVRDMYEVRQAPTFGGEASPRKSLLKVVSPEDPQKLSACAAPRTTHFEVKLSKAARCPGFLSVASYMYTTWRTQSTLLRGARDVEESEEGLVAPILQPQLVSIRALLTSRQFLLAPRCVFVCFLCPPQRCLPRLAPPSPSPTPTRRSSLRRRTAHLSSRPLHPGEGQSECGCEGACCG